VRKLGQTLSALARYRRHWSKLLQAGQAASRPAARSDHLTEVINFGSNPGALRMFTYPPKSLRRSPPLVVVLHGCTQSAAGYDLGAGWSTLADRYRFVLLFPEQTQVNNPKTCFNWFLPGDTSRDRGEAMSIRQMIEKTITVHGVDSARVFVTGLSAGGAMTAVMMATYPEVFAAGAIIAGLPYGSAGNVQQAFESMFQGRDHSPKVWGDLVRGASTHTGPWPRVSIWHGDADPTVKPINAESLIRQWTNVHGINSAPAADKVDGYPRLVWRRDGVDLVESYTITGMAHGAPLATQAHGGTAGPFLLEAGISSSYHIARFFGLTAETGARLSAPVDESTRPGPEDVEIIPDERVEILDAKSEDRPLGDMPIDVMAVITKALTQAGLMKPPK
jgi:poly(hydroxyalkanoate) depolymerase family esterase